MSITISTHNGSEVSIEHNKRNRRITDKEPHIDRDGHFEIWHTETLTEAYNRLFGEALAKYNLRQERADRRIKSYLQAVKDDVKKHPCYEMIIGVYSSEDNECSEILKRDILKQFTDEWSSRNPNLELIGAYLHADEEGQMHVHLDYVPVAHGYKRGLETQNGLNKALEEMGFKTEGKATAQIQWQRRENKYLEALCNSRGLSVEHPDIAKGEHLATEIFKLSKEKETLTNTISDKAEELKILAPDISNKKTISKKVKINIDEYNKLKAFADKVTEVFEHIRAERKKLSEEKEKIKLMKSSAEKEIKEANEIQGKCNKLLQALFKKCEEERVSVPGLCDNRPSLDEQCEILKLESKNNNNKIREFEVKHDLSDDMEL